MTEVFPNSSVADRLASKCYEVQYHLEEDEQNELIDRAKQWEHETDREETMSSSLLVCVRKERSVDESL